MSKNTYKQDESLETPFSLGQYKRALGYVSKYKKSMAIALGLSILSAILTLSAPLITGKVVDEIIPSQNVMHLIIWVGLLLVFIAIAMAFVSIRAKIMARVGQSIVYDIRSDLFTHLQYLSFDYYDKRPDGKILIRLVNYVNSVSDMLSNGLVNLILEIINVFIILAFMFYVNSTLSWIILSGVPIGLLAIILVRRSQRKAWQDLSNKASNTNAYLQESINGMQITQIYNRERENLDIFANLSQEYKSSWIKAVRLNALFPFVVDNIMNIITMIIYAVGLLVLDPGTISLGVILAMGSYALRFWNPILNIANIFNSFVSAISYLERIFETLDEPILIQDKEVAIELDDVKGDVEFKHVDFSYEKGHPVLEDVSFKINRGQKVAIVGATGAGKTTIVNLLSRFYEKDAGEILIDDREIEDVSLKSLRQNMGIMMQDSFMFAGSIKDNIRYGNLDTTDEEIIEVCQKLGIHKMIENFDDGYDTKVDNRSSMLSEGQKQLIAMARTIVQDPKILILDEATSSIDTQTELLVQKGLDEMMKDRTSFVIAHRLSTIQNADVIFYMDDKKIKEKGTHDSLMALKGQYYELVLTNQK